MWWLLSAKSHKPLLYSHSVMVADYCSVHSMRTRYEYSTAENMKPFVVVVQSLSCIWLFVTPWTAALQASLSFTISWRMLKLTSFESMMLSNLCILCHLFFSCLQSFPASGSFPVNWLFASGGQSVGASASTPVLPVNIQSWFPLGLISLISLLSKELSMPRDWGLGSFVILLGINAWPDRLPECTSMVLLHLPDWEVLGNDAKAETMWSCYKKNLF